MEPNMMFAVYRNEEMQRVMVQIYNLDIHKLVQQIDVK